MPEASLYSRYAQEDSLVADPRRNARYYVGHRSVQLAGNVLAQGLSHKHGCRHCLLRITPQPTRSNYRLLLKLSASQKIP